MSKARTIRLMIMTIWNRNTLLRMRIQTMMMSQVSINTKTSEIETFLTKKTLSIKTTKWIFPISGKMACSQFKKPTTNRTNPKKYSIG